MHSDFIIISPFKDDKALYPHLRHLVNLLKETNNVNYVFFRERGLDFAKKTRRIRNRKYDINRYFFFLTIIYDVIKLFLKFKYKKSPVIAVDNLIYVAANIAGFRKTILWSHDFIGFDEAASKNIINKFLNGLTEKYLLKNRKIIIQDQERLTIFAKSVGVDKRELNYYLLPVSLKPGNFRPLRKFPPSIIQIGGINTNRSCSHLILDAYQKRKFDYQLIFHGYIHDSIKYHLENAKESPVISSQIVEPEAFDIFLKDYQIGFLSYNIDNLNFYHIKLASNQLVEFLRVGIPVVSFGNSDMNEFVELNGAGFSIGSENINNFNLLLEEKIQLIMDDYESFSKNSLELYEKYFNIENYKITLNKYFSYYD
jgi:hypothetical protein